MTLNHHILLTKLHHYAITDVAVQLIKSYLSNRTEYVYIHGINSNTLDITTRVPQGSILGPLLFIIYINDLPKASSKCHSITYTDDTTLSTTIQSFNNNEHNESIEEQLNKEIYKITEWLDINKLSLNVAKSAYIIHKHANKQLIRI